MSSATGTCSWPSTGPRACVYGALEPDNSVRSAQAFLQALARVAPFRIATLPTDHCQAFTDRFVTVGERTPTGQHAFDRLCQALGIGHRLTRPRHPQTHGGVERFNNRIADLLRTHCFRSRDDLRPTLHRYVTRYNHHPPQQGAACSYAGPDPPALLGITPRSVSPKKAGTGHVGDIADPQCVRSVCSVAGRETAGWPGRTDRASPFG